MMKAVIDFLAALFRWDTTPIHPDPSDAYFSYNLPTNPMPTQAPKQPVEPIKYEEGGDDQPGLLYQLAKSLLGQHLTMNEAVPWMVGCMEAVSRILDSFGVPGIPVMGIEGTAAGLDFLIRSPRFKEIPDYEKGAVLVAATGTGNGKIRGHVGICGINQIMSNNSETGKWDTQWTVDRWLAYYGDYGGIKTRYFLPV